MNFTQEIKRELIKSIPEKQCCRCALLAAVLDTSGDWDLTSESGALVGGFSITSESEEIVAYLLNNVEQRFGVQMTLVEAVRDPKHGKNKLTFSYYGDGGGEIADEITDYSSANKIDDCCAQTYLKGAFLCGGSCTLPKEGKKTGYHLEVVFNNKFDAEDFQLLLDNFQLIGNIVVRGDKHVLYLKSRESISDFLSIIGAESALRKLETVSSEREERNNENRVINCLAGNADKAAIASAAQVKALRGMKEEGKFLLLTEQLRLTAEARLDNPELSLSELAEKLNLTKSGLSHRLRKLMEISSRDSF